MRKAISIVFLFAIGLAAAQTTRAQLASTPVTQTASAVRRMVDVYLQSIVDADAKLGATVWSPTPDMSFIEPRGNEQVVLGHQAQNDICIARNVPGIWSERYLSSWRMTMLRRLEAI
jgi:hypothetical protein